MARGVKRATTDILAEIDSKIADFTGKVNDFKAKIKDLESQKKSLLEAENKEKLQKILEVAEEKGLSVDDIIKKISK